MPAIAPRSLEVCERLRSEHELSFDVLSDVDHAVLDRYGLGFEFPEQLQETFCQIGLNLPEVGGAGHWVVTTPATMLVGPDQIIEYVDIDADFRRRSEPSTILKLLCPGPCRPETPRRYSCFYARDPAAGDSAE